MEKPMTQLPDNVREEIEKKCDLIQADIDKIDEANAKADKLAEALEQVLSVDNMETTTDDDEREWWLNSKQVEYIIDQALAEYRGESKEGGRVTNWKEAVEKKRQKGKKHTWRDDELFCAVCGVNKRYWLTSYEGTQWCYKNQQAKSTLEGQS